MLLALGYLTKIILKSGLFVQESISYLRLSLFWQGICLLVLRPNSNKKIIFSSFANKCLVILILKKTVFTFVVPLSQL
jgi:hypothetical protein